MTLLKHITPEQARALIDANGILVDVREPSEQAAERIPGAMALPLSRLASGDAAALPEERAAIFFCTSGARTTRNSAALAALADVPSYCMDGGILAWKRAGLPTERG